MSAPPPRSAAHYVWWAAVSQALNAGTNVLVIVLLARALPVRDFGVVAMGLVFLPVVVAGLRGAVFEPAVVHAGLSRPTVTRVLTDAGLAGAASATLLAAVVVATGGPLAVGALLAIGALATTVQEAARWVLFGLDRPRTGAGLDGLWALVQVGGLAVSTGSAAIAAGAWAAGAVCSAIAGGAAVRRHALGSSGSGATRVWQWGLEYVVASGGLHLAILLAPLTGGVQVAAGLRGATALLGATAVILGGAQQAVAGRLRVLDPEVMARWGRRLGLGLGVLVGLACLPLLVVPDRLGQDLLGDTWTATQVVLPALVLQRVATAVTCGPAFVLRRSMGHTAGLWWRLILTVLTLLGVVVAAAFGSERAAAWALAAGAVTSIPIWLRMLDRATPQRRAGSRYPVTARG